MRHLLFVFAFVVASMSPVVTGQVLKGEGCCYDDPRPERSIKSVTAKAEAIFVGTLTAVEPARPIEWWKEGGDGTFRQTNRVTFTVESTLKGEKVQTLKTKGNDLVLLYDDSGKFLVFLHKENKDGFRFYPPDDVFPVRDNLESDKYHWEIGVQGGKRPPSEYGPYVIRFLMNESLWMAGDMARWSPSLRKDVEKELIALDPQFVDKKKADEVFSLTTRGCHFYQDVWSAPYIGLLPCPVPLSLVQAYVKVLAR